MVNKFTKYITLGWWLSLAFFLGQSVVISIFNLCATPILGFVIFASFVILSFSHNYNKNYEFSPYKGLTKLFKKKKGE